MGSWPAAGPVFAVDWRKVRRGEKLPRQGAHANASWRPPVTQYILRFSLYSDSSRMSVSGITPSRDKYGFSAQQATQMDGNS